MKTLLNSGTKPLTAKEKNQLATWRNAVDPAQRLFTSYYRLLHAALLEDYNTAIKDAEEPEDRQEAYHDLVTALHSIRLQCQQDWELLVELLQARGENFCPVKFRLQWELYNTAHE